MKVWRVGLPDFFDCYFRQGLLHAVESLLRVAAVMGLSDHKFLKALGIGPQVEILDQG